MKRLMRVTLLSVLAVLAVAAPGISAIPRNDTWYTQHYIIMQDFERTAYRNLSPAGRLAFQELFWQSRSPEAKATFAARLEYVKKNLWKENSRQPWNTDRGRTYLLNGNPVSIDYDQNNDWGSLAIPGQMSGTGATNRNTEDVSANRAEIWTYPFQENFIKYVFVFVQPSQWRMIQAQVAGNRYRGDLETHGRAVVFGVQDVEQYKDRIGALEKKK